MRSRRLLPMLVLVLLAVPASAGAAVHEDAAAKDEGGGVAAKAASLGVGVRSCAGQGDPDAPELGVHRPPSALRPPPHQGHLEHAEPWKRRRNARPAAAATASAARST